MFQATRTGALARVHQKDHGSGEALTRKMKARNWTITILWQAIFFVFFSQGPSNN